MRSFRILFTLLLGFSFFLIPKSFASDQWKTYKNPNGWKISYPKNWFSNMDNSPMGNVEIEFRNWDGYDPVAMNVTLSVATYEACQELTIEVCIPRMTPDRILGSTRYFNFKGYPAFEIKGESNEQSYRHVIFKTPAGRTFSFYTNVPTKEKLAKRGLKDWPDGTLLNQMLESFEVLPGKNLPIKR